jgi:hypothetical protein
VRVFTFCQLADEQPSEFLVQGDSIMTIVDKINFYADEIVRRLPAGGEEELRYLGYYVSVLLKLSEVFNGEPPNNGHYILQWQSKEKQYDITVYPPIVLIAYDLEAKMPLDYKAYKVVIDFDNLKEEEENSWHE